MNIYTTAPLEDPRAARALYPELEAIGYHGAFSFEGKHDPFITLAVAAEHTKKMKLGTAIAVAFARSPMSLANIGYDLQLLSEGRFVMGLGSQIKPHIEKRFSATWSRPAARMREIVLATKAIWQAWESGEKLRFEGEFYRHTLMIPAFNPGPNEFGPPPIFTGGFGPKMTQVAGEVADGFIVHPFCTRQTLLDVTLPALEKGLAIAGRQRSDIEIIASTSIVTGDTEEQMQASKAAIKRQLAFYASTPAYLPTLKKHGWEDLHQQANLLSKQGRWDDMATLIDDGILEAIAIVRPREEVAGGILEKLDGIVDSVSLANIRYPDPTHWQSTVKDLARLTRHEPIATPYERV